jgi:hypothetical protein
MSIESSVPGSLLLAAEGNDEIHAMAGGGARFSVLAWSKLFWVDALKS